MSDVVLTFDTDWAPDFVVRDTLELLGNTPATFFVTDEISAGLVKGIPTIEMGIHPNFLKKSSHGESYHEVLKTVSVDENLTAKAGLAQPNSRF